MRQLDPIVLREARARAQRIADAAGDVDEVTSVLLWFHDHATREDRTSGPAAPRLIDVAVLQGDPELILNAVVTGRYPGTDGAAKYLRSAYLEVRQRIIERAIELAQADLADAEGKTR